MSYPTDQSGNPPVTPGELPDERPPVWNGNRYGATGLGGAPRGETEMAARQERNRVYKFWPAARARLDSARRF